MTTSGDDKENKRVVSFGNDEQTPDGLGDSTCKSMTSADEILQSKDCDGILSSDNGTICSSCGHRECDDSDRGSVSEANSPQPESCVQDMTNDSQSKELSYPKHSEPCSTTSTAENDVSLVSGKQQKRVHWKDQTEMVGEESDEEAETQPEEEEQDIVEEREMSKRGRSREALTANSLPQLPHHFRR